MNRRPAAWLACAVLAAAIAGAPLAHAVTPAGTDGAWRQPDFSASHDPFNPAESTLTAATVPNVALLKSIAEAPSVDPSCGSGSTPLLTANHMFDISGTDVVERHVPSGRVIKRFPLSSTDDTSWTSLSLGHGVLLANGIDCDSVSDPNGYVVAYDVNTGAKLWAYSQPGVTSAGISDAVVVVGGGTVGSGDQFAAVDLETGKELWHVYADCLPNEPLVAGGVVVVTNCTEGPTTSTVVLEGYDLHTGTLRWQKAGDWTPYFADSSTARHAQIYAAKNTPDAPVFAIDAANGSRGVKFATAAKPLVADSSTLVATCGSKGRHLCGFDKSTGERHWVIDYASTPQGGGFNYADAAIAGDVLYLDDGRLLDPTSGTTISTLRSGSSMSGAPVVARGLIADSTADGIDLYGLPR